MSSLILPPVEVNGKDASPESVGPNCTTCTYFRLSNPLMPKAGGGCRFNPPFPQIVTMEQTPMGVRPLAMSFWPSVGGTDWCAKHDPRPVGDS